MKKIEKTPLEELQTTGFWESDSYAKRDTVKVHPVRSIYKTISWRIIATTDTFIISWFITGYFAWATAIASVEVFTKMFLYYFHERAWLKVKFRRAW